MSTQLLKKLAKLMRYKFPFTIRPQKIGKDRKMLLRLAHLYARIWGVGGWTRGRIRHDDNVSRSTTNCRELQGIGGKMKELNAQECGQVSGGNPVGDLLIVEGGHFWVSAPSPQRLVSD
jgi:hypothetical protein